MSDQKDQKPSAVRGYHSSCLYFSLGTYTFIDCDQLRYLQGWFYGGPGGAAAPHEKCAPQCPPPHFDPASLDFHLNRPVNKYP